ncbi:MAG: 5-oxoprolinase subunit PxpB [Bacteroidota bacterium]
MSFSIQPFGDRALLVNFEQRIDKAINTKVIALKVAIEQADLLGVTFLIPAYCSLTIGFEPKKIAADILTVAIREIYEEANISPTQGEPKPRHLRIPVCYDPSFGLDLAELSSQINLSVEEIIQLHTEQVFKVYMLGFMPGFVFMGKLSEKLQCARKATPRLRIPPRSVGIAGLQTGIYPTESPGGWQIIGRTPYPIFSPTNQHPFLFQAGDTVQFYSISKIDYEAEVLKHNPPPSPVPSEKSSNATRFLFLKTGLQTLVQDRGRFGYQAFGVPVSGAMDRKNAELANQLVGNSDDTPVLEMTLLGPTIEITGTCQIAITGADFAPKFNNQPLPRYKTISIKNGGILRFGGAKSGCRAYLAIRGQWEIPQWLDSYSALPYNGTIATPHSYLQKGSQLFIKSKERMTTKSLPINRQPSFPTFQEIKVLLGPELEIFSKKTIAYFFSQTFTISADANRMGYRLEERLMDYTPQKNIISTGVVPGTIQITNSGQPVVLMADAQTVGGYPRIANVLSSEMSKLAQLKPSDKVRFVLIVDEKI